MERADSRSDRTIAAMARGDEMARRRVVKDVFEDAYNYMKSGQLMRQVINKINGIDFNNLADRQHFGDIYEQILADLQSAGNAGEYYTPRAVTAFMVDRIDPKPGEILFDPACGTGGFFICALRHMRERYVKRPEDEQKMQAALRAVEKKQLPHMLCVTNMLLHGVEDASFVHHDNTLARPYISYTQADRVDIVLTNPPFGGREEDGIESNFPAHFRTRETADLFLALIIRLLKPGGRAAVVLPDGSLFGEGVKTRLKEHLMEECNLHTIVRLPNSVPRGSSCSPGICRTIGRSSGGSSDLRLPDAAPIQHNARHVTGRKRALETSRAFACLRPRFARRRRACWPA